MEENEFKKDLLDNFLLEMKGAIDNARVKIAKKEKSEITTNYLKTTIEVLEDLIKRVKAIEENKEEYKDFQHWAVAFAYTQIELSNFCDKLMTEVKEDDN